jgi:hypothetical protein
MEDTNLEEGREVATSQARTRGLAIAKIAEEQLDVVLDVLAVTSRLARFPEYARRFEAAADAGNYPALQRLLVEAGVRNRFVVEMEAKGRKITIEYHSPKCHTVKVTYED